MVAPSEEKKKPAENGTKPATTAASAAPKSFEDMGSAPEGFDREDQPSLDGWFKPATGNGFYGRIVGNFQVEDKKSGQMRDVVIIKLAVGCKAQQDKKEVTLDAGQFLGVSIRHKLQPLMEYVSNKGLAWVKTQDQVPIGGGQTMWNFEINCKGTKAAPPAPRKLTHEQSAAAGADDIPF